MVLYTVSRTALHRWTLSKVQIGHRKRTLSKVPIDQRCGGPDDRARARGAALRERDLRDGCRLALPLRARLGQRRGQRPTTVAICDSRWFFRVVETASWRGLWMVFWKATDRASLLNSRSSESDLKRLRYEERTKCKSRTCRWG